MTALTARALLLIGTLRACRTRATQLVRTDPLGAIRMMACAYIASDTLDELLRTKGRI